MSQPAKSAMSFDFKEMDDFVEQQNSVDEKEGTDRDIIVKASGKVNNGLLDAETCAVELEATAEVGDKNWIGMLVEYRQVNPVEDGHNAGVDFTEGEQPARVGLRYTCTVQIAESSEIFGCHGTYGFSKTVASFSSKKIAKKFAAKRAIDWLIANSHMPANGSVAFPKTVATPAAPVARPATVSYTTQVPGLCQRLGFNAPTYSITSIFPGAALCDGHAMFPNDHRVDGKVGEVTNVHGKKNAKEAIARLVVSFLRDIERQRLGGEPAKAATSAEEEDEDEDGGDDDKKRKRASVDSGATNKAIKV